MKQEKKCQTTIRIPNELMESIRELSYLTRETMNQIVIQALEKQIPDQLKIARKEK